MSEQPFKSPQVDPAAPPPSGRSLRAVVGLSIFLIGLAVLAYGAVAFWLLRMLPPNTPSSRLPSLYILFAGMGITLFGQTLRSLRLR